MLPQIFNSLERLDSLIRTKSTGTPSELAERMKMSERNLYYTLRIMKKAGAPIVYNKVRKSYCYKEEGRFSLGFIKRQDAKL